jgi:hypothetical protein
VVYYNVMVNISMCYSNLTIVNICWHYRKLVREGESSGAYMRWPACGPSQGGRPAKGKQRWADQAGWRMETLPAWGKSRPRPEAALGGVRPTIFFLFFRRRSESNPGCRAARVVMACQVRIGGRVEEVDTLNVDRSIWVRREKTQAKSGQSILMLLFFWVYFMVDGGGLLSGDVFFCVDLGKKRLVN